MKEILKYLGGRGKMIRFESETGSGFSMLEEDAQHLLELMKHSSDIPGAILPQDINSYLQNLQSAINAESANEPTEDMDEEDGADVALATRAFPLVEMLKTALSKEEAVLWREDDGVF